MPSSRHALFLFAATVLVPGTSRAQVDFSFDAGAARLLQVDLPQSDVITVGGQFRWQGARALVSSSAISAHTPEGSLTAQGIISASLFAPPFQRSRWELGASLSSFGATRSLPTVNAMAGVRQHFATSRAGAFVGAHGGGIVVDDVWRHAVVGQTGGWLRRRAHFVSLTLSLTDTRSLLRVPVPQLGTVYVETNPATYSDATAWWRREFARVDLDMSGGVRTGMRGGVDAAVWGSMSTTVWLTPRVALVASTGRALDDVVRGLPRTRYHTFALRVGFRDRVRAFTPRPRLPDDAPLLTVERRGDSLHVIAVRVPGASMVELMGDFTAWEPRVLTPSDGRWQLDWKLTPGVHRVAIRVDGGEWRVPANLPSVADDFGGRVGLLSIP